jgi:hypothetical protein
VREVKTRDDYYDDAFSVWREEVPDVSFGDNGYMSVVKKITKLADPRVF